MRDQIEWTQAAWAQVLRPLVRLALALGLKHAHLEAVLRRTLLEEAHRLAARRGVTRPNISQLSTISGLNRKDITARLRAESGEQPPQELSLASMVYTRWLQMATAWPAMRSLPIKTAGAGPSFEALAREASKGNVHHRAVLDDLVRLGMAKKVQDQVELIGEGFVPAGDLQDMLGFLGGNARDHLEAAVANTLGREGRMLERAVFAHGLSVEECERLHRLVRERWKQMHDGLVGEMTRAIENSGPQARQRMKVGVYVWHEDNPPASPPDTAEGVDADLEPDPPSPPSRKGRRPRTPPKDPS